MQSRRTTLKLLGASGAALSGIGTVTADANTVKKSPGQAGLRVVHAGADAPAVDVYVDGEIVLEAVPFGTASSYLPLEPGSYDVMVTATGDPDAVVFEATVELEARFYSAVAIGELEEETFDVLVLEDFQYAYVRLVHASPDAPAVDVTVGGGEAVVFDGVAFGETSEYVAVPAGSYTLEVRGDTEDNTGDVVGEFDVKLEAATAYSAYAIGYLTPDDEPEDRAFGLRVARDSEFES